MANRALAASLAALLLVLAPGPQALTVFAQTVNTGQTGSNASAVPVVAPVAANVAPGAVNALQTAPLALPILPSLALPLPAIQQNAGAAKLVPNAAAATPKPAATANIPALAPKAFVQRNAAAQAAVPGAAPVAAPTARETLETGTRELGQAQNPSDKRSTLDALFTGVRRGAEDAELPSAGLSAEGTAREEHGPRAAVSAADSSQIPVLKALALPDLEAVAVDAARPEAERKEAVASIAKSGDAGVPDSLRRVAAANPEGGAADYEVHRAALRALAGTGVILSLRPMSRAHADQVLAKLALDKPELAIFDFDDTLEPWKGKASPETAAALKAASDAGVHTHILTDRPDTSDKGDTTILDSLETLTPAQKAALTMQSSRGTRMFVFDRAGKAVLLDEQKVEWTAKEKDAVTAAAAVVEARYGRAKGKAEEFTSYTYFRGLPLELTKAQVTDAALLMEKELKARGIEVEVLGRQAKDPAKDEPYLTLSKIDKGIGVSWLRAHLSFVDRMGDVVRLGLSGRPLARLASLLRRIPERSVSAAKTLIVGDQFFEARNTDRNMLKGAPGAMALSVGGKADPRVDNLFVMPKDGHAGSMEVLGALGKTGVDGMNRKAVFGLFAQRTVSISFFILTTIAYPFIAVPAVGWAGYGALMALGPLAAIATGPLNGVLVDRLSARNSMALNTLVRVVMSLVLPALAYFGILNFWTLLVASFANGWMLSSTMTTENAYVKRLAGPKHLGTVNGLTWMNYLAIQVLLGLIFGVGQVVDKWAPGIAFLLSAAANAFLVLPIIWFTMPNTKNETAANPAAPVEKPAPSRTASALGWAKANALPAVLLAIGAALYIYSAPIIAALSGVMTLPGFATVFLKSTLPITAALVYWITRTSSFRALWRGEGREPSAQEKTLEAELAKAQTEGRTADAAKAASALKANRLRLRTAMLYVALTALMLYPLQSFLLPIMAEFLVGSAAKGMLLGQFTGALFFGNLISTSAQAKLPTIRLPLLGRIPGERLIQAAVVTLAAAWVFTRVVPGSALAAAAAGLAAAGLVRLASNLSNRGWIKFFGVGFAAVWFPFLVWTTGLFPFITVPTAVMISLLAIGMFYGPGFVSLNSYFQANAKQDQIGQLVGIQGSFSNTAISVGYGLISMVAASLSPVLPPLLAVCGAAYLIATAAFWRAPKRLPGLPTSVLKQPQVDIAGQIGEATHK
jgi:MFS family permease